MEAQMITVAVQMMGACYNDHGFNKKPCKDFATRISVTKALKVKCSSFCTCPVKVPRPTEVTEGDCEAVVISY